MISSRPEDTWVSVPVSPKTLQALAREAAETNQNVVSLAREGVERFADLLLSAQADCAPGVESSPSSASQS